MTPLFQRFALPLSLILCAPPAFSQDIQTPQFSIRASNGSLWTYTIAETGRTLSFRGPEFCIDGKRIRAGLDGLSAGPVKGLQNGEKEQTYTGQFEDDHSLRLELTFRWASDNPLVRFRYVLESEGTHRFTKPEGTDDLEYFSVSLARESDCTEIRLSDFDEKYHATRIAEVPVSGDDFSDTARLMGPMLEAGDGRSTFVLAYEHGSQFPDRFLEFRLTPDRTASLWAVKGNYLNGQPLDASHDYESIWFEVGGVPGGEKAMASAFRKFVLKDLSQNLESRKPYIFYNTWGRQERAKFAGGTYLSSESLRTTLDEIEVAHKMGVDVYVLDAGWFSKTGDWQVNTKFFPDTLNQVRALLKKYGMKLGLWINPQAAAVSSELLRKDSAYVMEWHGKKSQPGPIWETENSVNLDLVSPYWNDLADELIRLTRDLGVSYFTWDAVDQYACDGTNGYHGTDANSPGERADSYAFQLPIYLQKVVDKVCAAAPGTIFELDITEEGRSMGLGFLSSGKYIILNNGPYFHNLDISPPWETPLKNGNVQVFFNPGPARGWFMRSVLTYDDWLPSILFLTYYQADGPKNSALINVASLILGQNGIWGEITKTPPDNLQLVHDVLEQYKQVRDDVTVSDPVRTGEPGNSSEVYEKINPADGRGEVVLFSNGGHARYITSHRVDPKVWCTEGTTVHIDAQGHAVIEGDFKESSARIVFFGASPPPSK